MAFEYFETSEYILVCVLVTLGYSIQEIEFISAQRAMFKFKDEPVLQATVDKFWAGEIRIEPKKFYRVQNEIKDRIKYEKEKNHGKK